MNCRVLLCAVLITLPMLGVSNTLGKATRSLIANTDFASFGVGGLRDHTSGKITVVGITGSVQTAYLYWGAVTSSTDPDAAYTFKFDGVAIKGTNLGFSSSNCWTDYDNSQTYRADVTAIVAAKKNGTYDLTDLQDGELANYNGASLVIFFDDGNPLNNRDVYLFHGNDSSFPSAFDAEGWDANLDDVVYPGGTANITFHAADGEIGGAFYPDPRVEINGSLLMAEGHNFQGDSVPGDNNGPGDDGRLWDIKKFNLASFLSLGNNNLHLTGTNSNVRSEDCVALVLITIDVQSGCCSFLPNLICEKDHDGRDPFNNDQNELFRPEVICLDPITVRNVLECNDVDISDPNLVIQTVRLSKVTPVIKCTAFTTGPGGGLNTNFDSKLKKATNADLDRSLCEIALQRPPSEPCLGCRCLLFSPPLTTYTLQVQYVILDENGRPGPPIFVNICYVVQVPTRNDIRCNIEYFSKVAAGVTQKCKITSECAAALNHALDNPIDLEALLEFETVIAFCSIDFADLLAKNRDGVYDVRFKTNYLVDSTEEPIGCLLIEMADALLWH